MSFDPKSVTASKEWFEMGFQTPTFFVVLTPDENGHCEIDDAYFHYYENTLDFYYACLDDVKKTHPVTKENMKHSIMGSVRSSLSYVNNRRKHLIAEYGDNHPTRMETITNTVLSKEVAPEGYSVIVSLSYPCPIENEK
jgi:hypothetical protein